MLGVFTRTMGRVGRVARAPTRASKAEEEGGKALHGAEHHQRDSARARGSPLYFTRIAAAPRKERTRAPSPKCGGVERLEEWSAAARARATLTRWRRS